MRLMATNASAVLANCHHCDAPCLSEPKALRVHTDFFAVRPNKLSINAFSSWKPFLRGESGTNYVAEVRATEEAFKDILANHEEAWVIPKKIGKLCRVEQAGMWHMNHGQCRRIFDSYKEGVEKYGLPDVDEGTGDRTPWKGESVQITDNTQPPTIKVTLP